MTSKRGAARSVTGVLVFRLHGWIDAVLYPPDCSTVVDLWVVADSRMEAVLRAKAFGVHGPKVRLDSIPAPDAVWAAEEDPDRAVWRAWGDGAGWRPIAQLPRD